MDDSVIVEPLLGVRPWLAVDALGHSIEQIWGEAALNLSKQKVEGTPAPDHEHGFHDREATGTQSTQDEVPTGTAGAAIWIQTD